VQIRPKLKKINLYLKRNLKKKSCSFMLVSKWKVMKSPTFIYIHFLSF